LHKTNYKNATKKAGAKLPVRHYGRTPRRRYAQMKQTHPPGLVGLRILPFFLVVAPTTSFLEEEKKKRGKGGCPAQLPASPVRLATTATFFLPPAPPPPLPLRSPSHPQSGKEGGRLPPIGASAASVSPRYFRSWSRSDDFSPVRILASLRGVLILREYPARIVYLGESAMWHRFVGGWQWLGRPKCVVKKWRF
jgi:hypothetical protein